MKYIYFYNGDKKTETLIGVVTSDEGAWHMYSTFIKEVLHFEPYYYRVITHDDLTVIDYGSHTNFIHIKEN